MRHAGSPENPVPALDPAKPPKVKAGGD